MIADAAKELLAATTHAAEGEAGQLTEARLNRYGESRYRAAFDRALRDR